MYTYKTRVTGSQVDREGILTLPSLITIMQDCSQFWMESEPEFAKHFEEGNLALVLATRQVDIIRYPDFGEELEVATSIYKCKGFVGYRNTALYDCEGIAIAKSAGVGAFVNLGTGEMERLPRHILDSLTYDPPLEMEYLNRKIALPDTNPIEHPPIRATRSDIDFYKHVNNAQYIRMAHNFVPEPIRHKRLRVEYKNQARLGNYLTPLIYKSSSDEFHIQLVDEKRKPYAIIELS